MLTLILACATQQRSPGAGAQKPHNGDFCDGSGLASSRADRPICPHSVRAVRGYRHRDFKGRDAHEHPPARDEMLQVVRQPLDVFARLLLEAVHFDDLGDQHVIGLTDGLSGHVRRPREPPIRNRVQRPVDDVAILRHQTLKVLGQLRRNAAETTSQGSPENSSRSVVDVLPPRRLVRRRPPARVSVRSARGGAPHSSARSSARDYAVAAVASRNATVRASRADRARHACVRSTIAVARRRSPAGRVRSRTREGEPEPHLRQGAHTGEVERLGIQRPAGRRLVVGEDRVRRAADAARALSANHATSTSRGPTPVRSPQSIRDQAAARSARGSRASRHRAAAWAGNGQGAGREARARRWMAKTAAAVSSSTCCANSSHPWAIRAARG